MSDKKEPGSPEKFERILKKNLIWIVPTIILLFVIGLFFGEKESQKFRYSDFIQASQEGRIESVLIETQDNTCRLSGKFKGNQRFVLTVLKEDKFDNLELSAFLSKYNIKFAVKEKGGGFLGGLWIYIPIIFIFFLILRNMNAQTKFGCFNHGHLSVR